MHANAERIAALLETAALRPTVRELPDSTRTAPEAAEAIGTTVAQIAKSLVFVIAGDGDGEDRVAAGGDLRDQPRRRREGRRYRRRADQPPGREDRRDTHRLLHRGAPNAVFRLTPAELVMLSGGKVDDVKF